MNLSFRQSEMFLVYVVHNSCERFTHTEYAYANHFLIAMFLLHCVIVGRE